MRTTLSLLVCAAVLCAAAGCSAPEAPQASYLLGEDGRLIIKAVPPDYTETGVNRSGGVAISRITFSNPGGPVYALLAAPDDPVAAIVFVPGAGVKAVAHLERAETYAAAGIVFCVVDPRGNGDETPGYSFDIQRDFALYREGKWPQVYRVITDLIIAREMLDERYGVPVYAMGSSNGGRYTAISAAADPGFAGWFGISTSGYSGAAAQFEGDFRLFIVSIDPDTAVGYISPRPVRVYHAMDDRVIPFADGMALFNHAREPKDFIAFNGTHGITAEVDAMVMADVLTF
jgi:dienelactone hydrolase